MKDYRPDRRAFLATLATPLALPLPAVGAPSAYSCPSHRSAPAQSTLIVLMDRTTELPQEACVQFVRECVSLAARRRRTVVAEFGGETPSLLSKAFDEVVSAQMTQQEKERLRWEIAPAEIQTDVNCRAEQHQRLEAALRLGLQTANGPRANSPILEAIGEALRVRREGEAGLTLVLVSDAIQHYAPRSFYGAKHDSLNLPTAAALVDDLRRNGMLPSAHGAEVVHVGIGLATPSTLGPRLLRPGPEVQALKALWNAVWASAGAKKWTFGEPLPVDGLGR